MFRRPNPLADDLLTLAADDDEQLLRFLAREQAAIRAALAEGECIIRLETDYGGTAQTVGWGSAVVVTDKRLLVVRKGKVRESIQRSDISRVGVTADGDSHRALIMAAQTSQGVMIDLKSLGRAEDLLADLGFEPA